MLVLGRKVGERIRIGDDVEVVVVGIKERRVLIGIAAPKAVPIQREAAVPRPNPPQPKRRFRRVRIEPTGEEPAGVGDSL